MKKIKPSIYSGRPLGKSVWREVVGVEWVGMIWSDLRLKKGSREEKNLDATFVSG
jgi:hypothetical protein